MSDDTRAKAISEAIEGAADVGEMLTQLAVEGWIVLNWKDLEFPDAVIEEGFEAMRLNAGFNPQWGVSLATMKEIVGVFLDEISLIFAHRYADDAIHSES